MLVVPCYRLRPAAGEVGTVLGGLVRECTQTHRVPLTVLDERQLSPRPFQDQLGCDSAWPDESQREQEEGFMRRTVGRPMVVFEMLAGVRRRAVGLRGRVGELLS
jgi:hypothetical protein